MGHATCSVWDVWGTCEALTEGGPGDEAGEGEGDAARAAPAALQHRRRHVVYHRPLLTYT